MLEGRSSAFGIKFRPGAFRSLLGRAVSSIAESTMPATALFGADAAALDDVLAVDDAAAAALASDFLRARLPPADTASLLAGRIVDSVADDLGLHSADELARRFDMSLRALQRLFNEHVGVGPKWVINRYRMHEAVARVQAGEPSRGPRSRRTWATSTRPTSSRTSASWWAARRATTRAA